MSNKPLMELEESFIYGLWPRKLLIFEDHIELRTFELLQEKAEWREYGQIGGVEIPGKRRFTNLLIRDNQGRSILIRGVERVEAECARTLIEEQTARVRERSPQPGSPTPELIRKLAELRDAGLLSQEEFETKRNSLINAGETRFGREA